MLKPSGILIASFLTPPPTLSKESTWKNVNIEDALKQKAIFSDIINAAWQVFRTEAETRKQLGKAGFQILEIIYDSQGIFPTVIARKK